MRVYLNDGISLIEMLVPGKQAYICNTASILHLPGCSDGHRKVVIRRQIVPSVCVGILNQHPVNLSKKDWVLQAFRRRVHNYRGRP